MKKKITKPAARTTRRTTSRKSASGQTVLFTRIVFVSACVTLFLVGVVMFNKHTITQSVAGTSMMRGMFMQTTVNMPTLQHVSSFNIYYREVGAKSFSNAATNISPTVPAYTISYLKKGATYEYRFAAVDSTGKEFLFSEVKHLTGLRSM